MSVLSAQHLSKQFRRRQVVRDVSLSVESGEIVGLLGPNGAGKSTTMKIMTGFLAPTGGEARVAGHDVLTEPRAVREHLGYLPENAPIYPDMTVRAYLTFVGRTRGLGAAERARAIDRVTDECGLQGRLGQRVGTLSRGFRQRVGLAQALLHEPPLLILDEPTTGLDPNQIVEIRAIIRRVGKTRTVILSTHILPEVQVTCDRVLIIHQGRLVADGATDEVTASSSGNRVTIGLGAGKVQVTDAAVVAELEALDGVLRVQPAPAVDEARRFTVHAELDVREAVYRWAVERGHVLLELSSERSNLEEVFRRLTATEDAA